MKKTKFKTLILDVDGVMTDGKFYYTEDGKIMKVFGADDNDALSMLKNFMDIIFVTGDKKGFKISRKRIVEDMKFELYLVSTLDRVNWIENKYNLKSVIYIGDGIFDNLVMDKVGYSICPSNSDKECKKSANFITKRAGGDRAVAEAVDHIFKKFLKIQKPLKYLKKNSTIGEWAI
tara:strand:- start:4323 stop:4850 length:528 start_codon:yes stop_codon:yes gene_type:complete